MRGDEHTDDERAEITLDADEVEEPVAGNKSQYHAVEHE